MKLSKILLLLFIIHSAIFPTGDITIGEDIIRIGYEASLSGVFQDPSKSMLDGIKLGIKEINHVGGILGKKVELFVFDDSCEVGKTQDAWNDFFKKNTIDLVLANLCGKTFTTAASLARRDNKILVSAGPLGAWLISKKKNPWSFPLGLGFHAQADALNTYLRRENINNVGLIVSEQRVGMYAHDFVVSEAKLKGINIKETLFFPPGTTTEFKNILLPLTKLNLQGILIISDLADFPRLIKGSSEIGLKPQIWAGIITDNPDFTPINLKLLEGIIFPYNFTYTSKEGVNFVSKFKKEYRYSPYFFAKAGYDLVYLVKKAIEAAGTTDPKKLGKQLQGFSYETGFGRLIIDPTSNQLYYENVFLVTPKKGELILLSGYRGIGRGPR